MRKHFILFSCIFFALQSAKAQDIKPAATWNIDVGPTLAVPIRVLHMYSGPGIGIDGGATRFLFGALAGGARINYSYFFGKSFYGFHYSGTNLINILGDAHYLFPQNIEVGVDLGLGLGLSSRPATVKFARIGYVGYEWPHNKRTYTFSVFYDQTTWQKNLGIRASVRI